MRSDFPEGLSDMPGPQQKDIQQKIKKLS